MLYLVFRPSPELAPYVRFFWALASAVLPGDELVHRSMADGCVEIVFHYRGVFDELTVAGRSPILPWQAFKHSQILTEDLLRNRVSVSSGPICIPLRSRPFFRFLQAISQTSRPTSSPSSVLTGVVLMTAWRQPTAMNSGWPSLVVFSERN